MFGDVKPEAFKGCTFRILTSFAQWIETFWILT